MDCEKYSHMPNIYEYCETTFVDGKPNQTGIDIFMNGFNFSGIDEELKNKIFDYLIKKEKDFLKGKKEKDFLKGKKDYKSKIREGVIPYLDIALQFQLEDEDLQHLILIYLSSMKKEILLNKDKFRKRVYLDFDYINSDFKGDKLRKKSDSLSNKSVYSTSHIDFIIYFFDEYVMTYIHMTDEVIDNLEEFNKTYGYWVTKIKKLEKEEKVNTINKEFVKSRKEIIGVIIPNSVTTIGEDAFTDCKNLKSIIIPNSVTSISEGAFFDCSSLEEIKIPNSVTSIGRSAFHNCKNLKSIIIPNSVTSICIYAFMGCISLNEIEIPNSVTTIGERAFWNCNSLKSVIIPNSVTSIGEWAFYSCNSLKEIKIPNSVTSIGKWAFSDCDSLESVIIPNSVTISIRKLGIPTKTNIIRRDSPVLFGIKKPKTGKKPKKPKTGKKPKKPKTGKKPKTSKKPKTGKKP